MRYLELLSESISFSPMVRDGNTLTWGPFERDEVVDCWVCDGTGKDKWEPEVTCEMCHGKKKYREQGPSIELNIANTNALDLLEALGLEVEHVGTITREQFPEIKRKLIAIINSDQEANKLTKDTVVDRGKPGTMTKGSTDGNVTQLSKTGGQATMYKMGRTTEQIRRYAKLLLDVIKEAEKDPNGVVSWA